MTRTSTIVTTGANEVVAALHDRMPVILEQQDWPAWVGEVEGDPAALMRQAGEDVLKVWPVSKLFATDPRFRQASLGCNTVLAGFPKMRPLQCVRISR